MVVDGAILLSWLPVVAGVWLYRGLAKPERALLHWLAITGLFNLAVARLSSLGTYTNLANQLTYPLFCFMGLRALALMSGRVGALRIAMLGWGFYVVWWGWWLYRGELGSAFSLFNGPVMYGALSLASVVVLVWRLQDDVDKPWRDPAMLTAWGALITNAPFAAIDPVAETLYRLDPQLTLLLYDTRAALSGLGSVLFTLALVWAERSGSRSGLQSSPAP